MAKRSSANGVLSAFQVAVIFKGMSEKTNGIKPTKEEWVAEYAGRGIKISDEIISSALTMAEIEERCVFVSPADRAKRLIEQVERHEKKIESLNDNTIIPLVNRMITVESIVKKKISDNDHESRITGLEEAVRSLFSKWDEMNETFKK